MSNVDKQKRGISFKDVMNEMMEEALKVGYIKSYVKNYENGYPAHDPNQFKAPLKITFHDNTEWLVFSTTSLRDRIKQQYWDAHHLKILNHYITRAFLVYPDSIEEKEKNLFVAKNEKINTEESDKREFCPLYALLSQESFSNMLEEYALQTLGRGKQKDSKGKNFEKRIATIMTNPHNLEKWKNKDSVIDGYHYTTFEKIVNIIGIDRTTTTEIDATTDIPKLPSGGSPKTDVLIKVFFNDGLAKNFTFSCKRTDQKSVSVHQYKADTFADVLAPDDDELRRVLNAFQTCGNKRDMVPEDAQILEDKLQPLIPQLCQWAIGGVGGEGDPNVQWAQYIIAYDDNTQEIVLHTTAEYCKKLVAQKAKAFRTPFSWTYQGDRGTNIQLKCSIFL